MILKLTLGKAKIDTVPLSFIQNHKYHSKDTRRAHPNPTVRLPNPPRTFFPLGYIFEISKISKIENQKIDISKNEPFGLATL